jgi:hypothetical protein
MIRSLSVDPDQSIQPLSLEEHRVLWDQLSRDVSGNKIVVGIYRNDSGGKHEPVPS